MDEKRECCEVQQKLHVLDMPFRKGPVQEVAPRLNLVVMTCVGY